MKLFVFLMALTPVACFGQEVPCHQVLSQGKDSTFYQITDVRNFNPAEIIRDLLAEKCRNERVISASCKRFDAIDETTQVCYVTSSAGYFFVTKDYLDNVNIVFSRWD